MSHSETTSAWPAPAVTVGDRSKPRRFSPIPGRRATRRATIAALSLAAATALVGLDRPGNSVGLAALLVAAAVAVVVATDVVGAPRRLILASAILFAPWLAVRSSPWLLVPNVIAIIVLGLVGLSARNGAGLIDGAAGYGRRTGRAVAGVVEGPAIALRGLRANANGTWLASTRGLVGPAALGVVAAVLVTAILASGDALFASYLAPADFVDDAAMRFVSALWGLGAVVAGGGIAATAERRSALAARARTTPRGAIVALAPLCVVYLAYVAVQCSTLLLGAQYVRNRTGLTFAEYARSGFFQLVAVGVLTFVALTALRPVLRVAEGRERRVLRALGGVAAACTLAMVIAAIVKLDLYGDVFGLTMLRLHTTVFAVWLGLALTIAAIALVRLDGEWVFPVVATTALCGVLAMNFVNPERVVAEHNLTATIDSPEFDVGYLLSLSDDAVPPLADHLDDLPPAARQQALAEWCLPSTPQEHRGPIDWNASATSAADLIRNACNE